MHVFTSETSVEMGQAALYLHEWGIEPATNPVALVSDLIVRKVVFCVLRFGTSATCECEASLPHATTH